jgi:HPt (histidine-containing phosphotransfer) domain-containing protein
MPIVGLTADVTAEQHALCLDAGMTDVMIKPLTLDRLSRLVHRLLPETGDGDPSPLVQADALDAMDVLNALTRAPDEAQAGTRPKVFDDSLFRELFPDGDPEGAEWIGEYQDTAGRLEGQLAELLNGQPVDTVRRDAVAAAAHRLAGSSLSVGAARAGDAARALERAAATAGPAELQALFAGLGSELAAAHAAMDEFLSGFRLETV